MALRLHAVELEPYRSDLSSSYDMCVNTHAPCGTRALLKKSYPLFIILQLEHLRLTVRCNLVDDILTWLLYIVLLYYVEELFFCV